MESDRGLSGATLQEFVVCADDGYSLQPEGGSLVCPVCRRCYEVQDGIAMMLPRYEDDQRRRYFDNYQTLARDDLATPFEGRRDARVEQFVRFMGDVRGKRVLDIGSGSADHLMQMDARVKVALDIALPYLRSIPREEGILRVCADAEQLPILPGYFDVIILSAVLEHVLSPEAVVARIFQACGPNTRVFALVPWEEDLSPYREMDWEFTHLRSFNSLSFSALWHQFSIRRRKATWPRLSDPILFRLDERLPTPIFNLLRYAYFHQGLATAEANLRQKWSRELPRRERRLLLAYRPTFYQFELTRFGDSRMPHLLSDAARFGTLWSKILRRE